MNKGFFKDFGLFLSGPAKGLFFTAFFYTVWIVAHSVYNTDFGLRSFPGRMIGISTLEAFDVGARVSFFYKTLCLIPLSFLFFLTIGFFINRGVKNVVASTEARIINHTSLAGMMIYLFVAFEVKCDESLEIVYYLHKLMLTALVIRLTFFSGNRMNTALYGILISLGFAIYFFVADCFTLAGSKDLPDFYITSFAAIVLMLVWTNYFLKTRPGPEGLQALRRRLGVFLPLTLLPIAHVLKDELYLVLKTNGIVLANALPVFAMLCLLLALAIAYGWKKQASRPVHAERHLLTWRYLPMMVFSLLTFLYYERFVEFSDEVFESGNKYLPIMEFNLFGVLPTLEKLNSHLISDYFFSGIFTLLNGLKGTEMELYDFLFIPVSYTMYYVLLACLTRNPYLPVFFIFLFPLAGALFPGGYCLGVVALLALSKVLNHKESLKKYRAFFFIIVGLVAWRIDLGYGCMLVIPPLLLFYNFMGSTYKINWKLLFRALLFVLATLVLVIAACSLYRHTNLFGKMLYALNYFSSAQTYGYRTIGWENLPAYRMHYFVFPVAVAIILLALIIKFRELNTTKTRQMAYLALIFMCGYYFANFNRGLIRHSLIEWDDSFTSSYVYLIIPGSVFVFYRKQSQVLKFSVFGLIAFFTIWNYRLPEAKGMSALMELFVPKTKTSDSTDITRIATRIKHVPKDHVSAVADFTAFIKKNTAAGETFIDFANRPMLYFYTQKITPSYFYQNPLCSHNDYLQDKFIDDLKDYKTPYLLFSGTDERGFDIVDQVPNPLRHYRMAEYFYKHYKPYIIVSNMCVWKENGVKDNNKGRTVCRWDNAVSRDTLRCGFTPAKDKKYILKLVTQKAYKAEIKCFEEGSAATLQPNIISGKFAYCLLETKAQRGFLQITNPERNILQAELVECDYLPDFYSERYVIYDFKKLPYIWAAYDGKLPGERVLFRHDTQFRLKANEPCRINIPEKIDRETGNTVVITCLNKKPDPQKLCLLFGNKRDNDRTKITLDVMPSGKAEKYAIRISSIYKWYSGNVNLLELLAETTDDLEIINVQITKGS